MTVFRRRAVLGASASLILAGAVVLAASPVVAAARPLHGVTATVAGASAWWGSYDLGRLGTAWGLDPGRRPPNAAMAFTAVPLAGVDPDTATAVAWVVARYGYGPDPVAHAAVALALADLLGFAGPAGPVDVRLLRPGDLGNLDPLTAMRLARRARAAHADALAHRHLRGELSLQVEVAVAPSATTPGRLEVRVQDTAGRPASGIQVTLDTAGAQPGRAVVTTDNAGRAELLFLAPSGAAEFLARAEVPVLIPDVLAPTHVDAQRVLRPARRSLVAQTTQRPPAPQPEPEPTPEPAPAPQPEPEPAPEVLPTTAVPPVQGPAAPPAPSTGGAAPGTPAVAEPAVGARPALPRTGVHLAGADLAGAGLVGSGLVLLGLAALGGRPGVAATAGPRCPARTSAAPRRTRLGPARTC
jgi:outer membrane biosynthesis protein TonB